MPRAILINDTPPSSRLGEAEFHKLLDKLPAGAYTCDPQGLITYYNQQAVELWGRAPRLNDPVDRFCGSFKLLSVEGLPIEHEECWMAIALSQGRSFHGCEIIVERPDGRRLFVLAHASPIYDDAGRLAGAVNVLVDINDRKRLENALREADRSKNEFLATLAHELRNPLAPLRNAAQILRMKASAAEPETQWALEVIERQTQHMSRLIDDLLDISRLTRNRLELRRMHVALENVIRVAVETSRPLIEAAGHNLVVDLPRQRIMLNADLTRLAQAVTNLLNNAAKYTPPGGRIVLAAQRQGSDAVIAISDNGIGIPPELLPRVFQMFTQAQCASDGTRSGLGIGLSLVQRIVELHGGSISAQSDGPGNGSRFEVRLPAVVPPDSNRSAPAEGSTARRGRGPALRVLVADDSRDSANSLAMLLRINGHIVNTAYDGVEAVEAFGDFRPDVVLLDIGMPRMDGYEAARRIRALAGGERVALVALTGWGQDEDRQRSREAGFDHHLLKPVDPTGLLELLLTLVPAPPDLATVSGR